MCDTTGVTSLSLRNPDLSPSKEDPNPHNHNHHHSHVNSNNKSSKHGNGNNDERGNGKQNQVGSVMLCGVSIVSLVMDGKERLCLAQISSTLLKDFSYNEIHNRRVALGITCVQCTPVQLEILRRAGAMPVTSRRCGMITRREAERLCQSFLGDHAPPQLPENFAFEVYHECGWGSRGSFVPSRYNSSRAKCIRCTYCQLFFSPNKFIFHSHRLPESRYVQPDAANFNSWRRHLRLMGDPPDEDISPNTLSMDTAQIVHAWEDVRAMFNGGTRKRMLAAHSSSSVVHHHSSSRAGGENHTLSLGHRRGGGGGGAGKNSDSNSGGGSGQQNISSGRKTGTPQPTRHSLSSGHHHGHGHGMNSVNHIVNNPGLNSGPNSQNHSSTDLLVNSSSPSNNFISSVSNPLLSPSSRLENIWNPGLSPVNLNSSRFALGPLSGASQLQHLPFHPLSIPWLRRPLFPFPHPFAPAAACHLLADAGLSVPEKLATLSGANKANHSAFKPVSRNAEHLFSWLNNNPMSGESIIGSGCSLPEDLSTSNHHPHSHNHSHSLLTSNNGVVSQSTQRERETSQSSSQEHSPVSSTNDENIQHIHTTSTSSRTSSNRREKNARHQVQILSSAMQNDSDDDENVDIESTEVDEECSSTSFIWVTSTNNNNNVSPNNNNNNNNNNMGRKRLSVDSRHSSLSRESYSGGSGDDEKFGSGENPSKRKRLWDFDSSENVKKSEVVVCCNETRTSGVELSKD